MVKRIEKEKQIFEKEMKELKTISFILKVLKRDFPDWTFIAYTNEGKKNGKKN